MRSATQPSIQLERIRIDGGTQPRVEINLDVVADYAERMRAGDEFPPVDLFHDGVDWWLADGFNRYHASTKAGRKTIDYTRHDGTLRDAILFSVAVNKSHGLRRSDEDKRAAVQKLLGDSEWEAKSDRWIANHCAVTHALVGKLRKKTGCASSCRKSRDGKTRDTTAIARANRKRAKLKAVSAPPVEDHPRADCGSIEVPVEDAEPIVGTISPPACPNCGGIDRTDDGDCAACFDPCTEQKPAEPMTLRAAHAALRAKEETYDRPVVCGAIAETPTETVATAQQPKLAELYDSIKRIASAVDATLSAADQVASAAESEHWTSYDTTQVCETLSAIAHDFSKIDKSIKKATKWSRRKTTV